MEETRKLIEPALDFDGADNLLLLNPRLPSFEHEYLRRLVDLAPPLEAHVWMATSGSSGRVKMAALSKRALRASAEAVNLHLKVTSSDRWVANLPVFHVGGLGVWIRAKLSASTVVEYPLEKWDPRAFAVFCEAEEISLASLVPTQLYDLVRYEIQAPAKLRAVVLGGAALGDSLYRASRRLGWPVLPSYGLTETCSQIATAGLETLEDPYAALPRLRLLSHIQARVNDEGLLELKGASLFTGYARDQDGQVELWDPKHDAWFTTEDRAELEVGEDQKESLKIFGRGRDYIKVGGEGVDLLRLDEILSKLCLESETRLEAGIVPVVSERLGHEVHLVIAAFEEDESIEGPARSLFEAFNEKVAPFERARAYHIWPALPKSAAGKFLRAQATEAIRNPKKVPIRWAAPRTKNPL